MTLTLVHWEAGVFVPPLELWKDFSIALINWMGWGEVSWHGFWNYSALLGCFLHRMLNLGTQPPCYRDAQTSPRGETTCGEKLRLPADTASINYQTSEWMSHQMIPVPSLCVLELRPRHTSWSKDQSPPLCPVLIPDPENLWAE